MIEVKATVNFSQYTAGSFHQVDETDPRIAALLGAGYLVQTQCFSEEDEPVEQVIEAFERGAKGRTRKPRKKVTDGTDCAELSGSSENFSGGGETEGDPAVAADPDGS